ncbi:hypothetical protein Val02_90030 [Virgisporangium aliadipatigenens]|uniref:Secreted protein n=1 Tax=Virgisporangium aliadipatigenens TaxID=741659 RepID=A0A8J3YX32_9ACTN|nr:hypothetical protein [Virgisporangium aliadipatigenens]GIJ52117.1 hypothetical protein Val02_90030 [Virgisporangium aliadipatigenens]
MDALLGQLPALVGVLVGTLGTVLATHVAERSRWSRAQSVRWDDRRVEAYAEYARALKEVSIVTLRLRAATGAPDPGPDRQAGLALLAEAEAERSKAWERVLLLGDQATVTAARDWSDAVRDLRLAVRADAAEGFDWEAGVRHMDTCRDRFYAAARAGLSVGGAVAQAAWLADRNASA